MTCRTASRALLLASLLALLQSACPASAAFEISWPDARAAAMLAPSSLIDLDVGVASPRAGECVRGCARVDSLDGSSGVELARVALSGGRLYGLGEVAGWSARASAHFRGLTAGLGLSRVGSDLYAERVVSLAARVGAADGLFLRGRARVLGIAARGIDDRWSVALDAGVTRRLMGRILLGASCENIGRARVGASQVPTRTVFGAALALPSVSLQWTLLMEEPFAPSPTLGFEASLTDWVRIRAGARDAPGRLGFGVGIGRAGETWPAVDISVQWHPRLGASSFVSVSIGR